MKKIICMLLMLMLAVSVAAVPASADDITETNVCYRRPVTSSSRMQFNEIYPLNLTDGNYSLRASSYYQTKEDPYEWFRIDLGADYTISEIVVSAIANLTPRSIAIDVWSNGKWVRVVQDYEIESADYPKVYYFDEIDASYIQISTNELTNVPADAAASNIYMFTIAEVEAYHTKGISEKEKAASFEETPEGGAVIPAPQDVNSLFFRQGLRSDSTVNQQIPENDLLSFKGQYEGFDYYSADIDYLNGIYKEASGSAEYATGGTVPSYSAAVSSGKLAVNSDYYYETSVDWNPILLGIGIALIALGIIGIVITLILHIRRKKKK